MDKKKVVCLGFLFISLLVVCVGCGNKAQLAGESAGYVRVIDELPREGRLQEFDNKLAAISDEASASDAVDAFASYVCSRAKKDKGEMGIASANGSLNLSKSLVDKIIKIELAQRVGGAKALETEENPITPAKVAEDINSLIDDPAQRIVQEETIKVFQKGIRKELPHITENPESDNMTPMEAMVIGYTLYSGDEGSATPESVSLPDADKILAFGEKITE